MSTHNLCFEQKHEKYQIFLSEILHFLVVKFSIYLNRHVVVMYFRESIRDGESPQYVPKILLFHGALTCRNLETRIKLQKRYEKIPAANLLFIFSRLSYGEKTF